jgi:hypothetical protein
MHMIGHDHPSVQRVPFTIETQESPFNEIGNASISEKRFAVPAIKGLLNSDTPSYIRFVIRQISQLVAQTFESDARKTVGKSKSNRLGNLACLPMREVSARTPWIRVHCHIPRGGCIRRELCAFFASARAG